MHKKSIKPTSFWKNTLILLTSTLILYSILVDFILKPYISNKIAAYLITFQEKIYWIIVIIVILATLYLLLNIPKTSNITKSLKNTNKKILLIIALLLIISSVRFIELDAQPINIDEAELEFKPAKNLKDNGFFQNSMKSTYTYANLPMYAPANNNLFLTNSLIFINLHIFQDPIFALRSASVLIGILTILLTFSLIKDLYGYKVGILSSFFLALLPWHVLWSRTPIPEIYIPLFALLTFYAFCKTIKHKDPKFLFLLSIILGISIYVSIFSRLFLAIIPILMILYFKNIKKYGLKNIIIALLIFSIFLYPLLALTTDSDYQFNKKIEEKIEGQTLQNYVSNLKIEIKTLFINQDHSIYGTNLKGPLLGTTLSIIFLIALISALVFRKKELALIWILIILLGMPLIKDIRSGYLLGIIPIFFIFISKFLTNLKEHPFLKNKKYKTLIPKIVTLAIFLIIFNQTYMLIDYFKTHDTNLNENIMWSYGVDQAVSSIFEERAIDDKFVIFDDYRMTSQFYLWDYYLSNGYDYPLSDMPSKVLKEFYSFKEYQQYLEYNYLKKGYTAYFLVWAFPSNNPNHQEFKKGSETFNKDYPNKKPIKTIHYPTGEPAINIYRIN